MILRLGLRVRFPAMGFFIMAGKNIAQPLSGLLIPVFVHSSSKR
jgi:hypothetical protein